VKRLFEGEAYRLTGYGIICNLWANLKQAEFVIKQFFLGHQKIQIFPQRHKEHNG
jgi:hypothetical protein